MKKKNQFVRLTLPDFKIYYKSVAIEIGIRIVIETSGTKQSSEVDLHLNGQSSAKKVFNKWC